MTKFTATNSPAVLRVLSTHCCSGPDSIYYVDAESRGFRDPKLSLTLSRGLTSSSPYDERIGQTIKTIDGYRFTKIAFSRVFVIPLVIRRVGPNFMGFR